ncbi:MAG TPA: hypothetical protein VFV48_04240, partial [Pseudomonadales bacterium]|nr:hypothetical protein [Pseudomonadales bacterium]
MTKNKSARWLLAMFSCMLSVNVFSAEPSSTSSSAPATPQDALIRGFAKYQAGRVENLVLNEFVDDLVEEPSFKAFFPATSNAVANFKSDVAGKRLIPLLQEEFKNVDLVNLSLAAECAKSKGSSKKDKEDKVNMANIVLASFKKEGSSSDGPFAKQILAFCGLLPVTSDGNKLRIKKGKKNEADSFIQTLLDPVSKDPMGNKTDKVAALENIKTSS